MKLFRNILLLLLLTSIGYSQNNLLKSGNNLIKVGNNLIGIPFNQYSMLFDGVDEYGNIDNVLIALSSTAVGTWSLWVKLVDATPSSQEVFISFGDTDGNEFMYFTIGTTGILRGFCRVAGTTQWDLRTTSAELSDGVWAKIALTQDGTEPVILVNGTKPGQSFTTSTDKTKWFSTATNLDNGRIAAQNNNGIGNTQHINGSIDEVLFINRAVTTAQDLIIYNSGSPKKETNIVNGVAFFRMGDRSTFDGTDFTFVDQISNNNSTSVNMELNDKTISIAD